MEEWLRIAYGEIGVHETPGPAATKRILEYHSVTTLRATSDEVAWCSAFLCWCLEQAGIESTRSAAAISWLDWGYEITEPKEGCIVILTRSKDVTKGHVGLWIGESDDAVCLLGGNQRNEVCEEMFPKSKIRGYRWPYPEGEGLQCR